MSVSVHQRKNQSLAIEMFQIKHGQSCEAVTDTFTQTIQEYIDGQNQGFGIPSVNIVYHGSESTSYLGLKLWEIVPVKINKFNSLNSFKNKIRK